MDYVKTTTEGYTPQDNELCIAKYENEYFRRVCLKSDYSETSSQILFVDYGNLEVVEHKDVRPMLKDFMEPNRLMTLCLIGMIEFCSYSSSSHKYH